MLRAFWTWDPVSCGNHRTFDEPQAYQNNKWFFDKSVWQKMFRAMSGCGFNAMFLANTHPFPFMIDMPEYPEARLLDDMLLGDYVRMHHWIFETALEYDIAPYCLFFSIYYPTKLAKSRGINQSAVTAPTDFALEYTHRCVRELLSSYPELSGIVVDASENVSAKREQFLQQAVVEAVDAVRPDAQLYVRGWCADPTEFTATISRRAHRPLKYSVKYTYEHLVDPNPDPVFTRWVEIAGVESIAAELWISNFEPWTSFSYETIEGIISNLQDIGCDGFSLHPLALYDWPRTSDTHFRFQFQRDLVYYSTWGGRHISDMIHQGQPRWLMRNHRLLPGFQAGSRILELLALYFAGDKQNQWHPQFCSVRDYDAPAPHLFSIEDMLHLDDQRVFWGREWWTEVTGDRVVHLAEYITHGTPPDSYGPEELIEELADLAEQAVAAGEKGVRSASGEKELPSFARDSLCMGRLGEFYIERLRAALAHARGNDKEAVEHMGRALGLFRDIKAIDSSHRVLPIRAITGRCALVYDWLDTVKALEEEYTDAAAGEFKRGTCYPIGKLEGTP